MVGVEHVADHLAIRKSSFLHFWVVVFEGDKKLHKLQTVSSRKEKVVQFWGSRAVRAVAAGPLQKSLISLGKMR